MAVFELVPTEHVRESFIAVERNLQKMAKQPHIHWHPVDVYSSLIAGRSNLFWLYEQDTKTGFIVACHNGDSVEIWIASALNGHTILLPDVVESMSQLFRDYGYRRMTFKTTRKGWAKVAPLNGWVPTFTEYERTLV